MVKPKDPLFFLESHSPSVTGTNLLVKTYLLQMGKVLRSLTWANLLIYLCDSLLQLTD